MRKKKAAQKAGSKEDDQVAEGDETLRERAEKILVALKETDPQYDINGYNNIWIVKPAGLS